MALEVAAAALGCWLTAAQNFRVPEGLLRAMAHIESAEDPYAVHRNTNGTVDLGLMQINSRWLPQLQARGIRIEQLFSPCVNIAVGAWILAQEVARYGYTWEAIGAYNAGPYDQRSHDRKLWQYREYAGRVLAYWHHLQRGPRDVDR